MTQPPTPVNWGEKAPSRPRVQFSAIRRSWKVKGEERRAEREKREAVIRFDVSYITPWIRNDGHERRACVSNGIKGSSLPSSEPQAANLKKPVCMMRSAREKTWAEQNECSWQDGKNGPGLVYDLLLLILLGATWESVDLRVYLLRMVLKQNPTLSLPPTLDKTQVNLENTKRLKNSK